MKNIVEAALRVAKKYPVFPTINKKPCWSNVALGVAKGQGGYKVATQDPERIRELFAHPDAVEVAVPMGAMSGLICVDVDIHKADSIPGLREWYTANHAKLGQTTMHRTRSGGFHFIFEHPGDIGKLPATLRDGVDLKASGTGYICFPPTEGYLVIRARSPIPFPRYLVEDALKAKGGSGVIGSSGYNDLTDEQLVQQVVKATSLYPAMRSLSYRLPTRRNDDGKLLTRAQQVEILHSMMQHSDAGRPDHPRHEDWLDRLEKIAELVDSAIETHAAPIIDDEGLAAMSRGDGLMEVVVNNRPIGPQRETTPKDIEKKIALRKKTSKTTTKGKPDKPPTESGGTSAPPTEGAYFDVSAKSLTEETIPPIKWIIPLMIPERGVLSIAGPSNVGKTRLVAALLAALAAGDTTRLGLPQCDKAVISLWVANEERGDDIKRRLKSAFLQHGDKNSATIRLRAKDHGMFRLVALNEVGNPEIDEDAVAELVEYVREIEARVVVFDPYVTLSDAIDENSAASAAVLTKAFNLVAELTGAAVIHIHHTPKNRDKDRDVIRGSSDGWRGSSAIYSALDCGFTLSNWMPKGGEQRKAWKSNYLEGKLSRWVVFDTAKIREGEQLDPVVFELVGQEMAEGEGLPIGVCRLSSAEEAENSLDGISDDAIVAGQFAQALVSALGAGNFTNMASVANKMGTLDYFPDLKQSAGKSHLYALLSIPRRASGHVVTMTKKGGGTATKWAIIIEDME